ncbi:MAG: methionine--tRNA ligase, partial [Firmicutes bacterium]|nr:methionine--tRNA ligase [Bacillota bacterium]
SVQKIFKRLYEKGYIYKGEYSGKYCTPCESFWTDSQLVDGKCPDCGREVTEAKEEAYFFKLSLFADKVEKLLTETDYLQPQSRVNEMINNFIKPGLEDLCVSRTTFKWGVPVDFDDKHVVYVWIDALTNYITLLGYENGKFDDFEKYWPADVHMTAKEIVRFHSIIWPAILIALELPLPKKLYGHGWITFDGKKMGKSIGNVIDPFILSDRYGVDAVRYHLLREMPFGSDCAFSNETMINRINSDLANDLGNLVSRTVAMVIKYFGGTIPEEKQSDDIDNELINMAVALKKPYSENVENFKFSAAITDVFKVISRANKYIDETAPWILAKDEESKPRLAAVLYNLLDTIRITSTFLFPVMPESMPKIWEQIGAGKDDVTLENADKFGVLSQTVTVKKGEVLFPRVDIEKEIEELNVLLSQNNKKEEENENKKSEIEFSDFEKIEMKLGEVIECEKIKKSKKLLKSQIKIGNETRQIVSGIAHQYSPEEMVGKKVVVVTNLKPAKLCGELSEGMILAAADKDGKLNIVTVDGDMENGAEIG